MTALLTMALQMAATCVVLAAGAFGVMWAIFHAADWLERKG